LSNPAAQKSPTQTGKRYGSNNPADVDHEKMLLKNLPSNRADDMAKFNTVQQPSDKSKPEMLGQAQDSFEEDEDEYNADSPERQEQNMLYKATSSK